MTRHSERALAASPSFSLRTDRRQPTRTGEVHFLERFVKLWVSVPTFGSDRLRYESVMFRLRDPLKKEQRCIPPAARPCPDPKAPWYSFSYINWRAGHLLAQGFRRNRARANSIDLF